MRRPRVLRSLFALAARHATLQLVFGLALAPLVFGLATARAQAPSDAGAPAPGSDAGAAPPTPEPGSAAPGEPETPAANPEAPAPGEEPGPVLEPPSLSPLELDTNRAAPPPAQEAKPGTAPAKKGWTAPETMFQLHGYMRLRAGLLKGGALGHEGAFDRPQRLDNATRRNYDPFSYFNSYDSRRIEQTPGDEPEELTGEPLDKGDGELQPVESGCGEGPGSDGRCKKGTLVGGDLRLRLKPEIHLSDDVRVKAWIDVLDNVGLGSLSTAIPGSGPRPSDVDLGNAIRVRRAWGEARNRDIGELRFGRMGADWGLGILDNGGDRNGIDSDFSSDVDRIMGMTNLAGFYFMTAYDWASQGRVAPGSATPSGVPIDRAQRDDLAQVTAAIAHRLDADVQRANLLRGEAVFNYGVYFVWRKQQLRLRDPAFDADANPFQRLDQKQYIPDLWVQFLWEGLRVELEAAFVAGSLEGGCPRLVSSEGRATGNLREAREDLGRSGVGGNCKFRQFGLALEAEYRLYDDRLGIHFLSGLATGDRHAYGLAQTNDASFQVAEENNTGNRTISTYQFHPDYRVDLILWRTLMRRVAGAYYFKPGISYDFIHDAYGQQAGARVDAIYSRATARGQTWGRDPNLGLELDLTLYYRSEDGPDLWDGFYGLVQFGILFPFDGLGYASQDPRNTPGSDNAIMFRGVAGIQF